MNKRKFDRHKSPWRLNKESLYIEKDEEALTSLGRKKVANYENDYYTVIEAWEDAKNSYDVPYLKVTPTTEDLIDAAAEFLAEETGQEFQTCWEKVNDYVKYDLADYEEDEDDFNTYGKYDLLPGPEEKDKELGRALKAANIPFTYGINRAYLDYIGYEDDFPVFTIKRRDGDEIHVNWDRWGYISDELIHELDQNGDLDSTIRIIQNWLGQSKNGRHVKAQLDIPPAIDFSYALEMCEEFGPDTKEYALLEALEGDDWSYYLDKMATTGVTVEYDLTEDCFRVTGFQCDTDFEFDTRSKKKAAKSKSKDLPVPIEHVYHVSWSDDYQDGELLVAANSKKEARFYANEVIRFNYDLEGRLSMTVWSFQQFAEEYGDEEDSTESQALYYHKDNSWPQSDGDCVNLGHGGML